MAGTLYVVATPIGNLDDLSPRARRTLASVALVVCEDTRRTGRLLERLGLRKPKLSCHRFNETRRLRAVLDRLRAGEDVALVSDGGTPVLSDPGERLVRAAHEAGIRVSPVPGPSAPAALLSVSGLPADRFVFEGFLPAKASARRRRLRELAQESRTWVCFEAPHRILDALDDLQATLGNRTVVLGRELTKLHETLLRGTPAELRARLGEAPVRGEITLAVAGAGAGSPPPAPAEVSRVLEIWRRALDAEGGDRRRALRAAARELGMRRAELSRLLDELDGGDP